MKQIWPNYSYSPTTNVLTLTGLNIDRDQLLLVAAPERGRIMYNFADSSVTASDFTSGANTALTLVATTAGLTTTAALVIYYDDQLQSTSISISNLPATQPVSISSVTIGNTVTIAGTVTANNSTLTNVLQYDGSHYFLKVGGVATTGGTSFPVYVAGTVTANPTGTQTIAGTVTASNLDAVLEQYEVNAQEKSFAVVASLNGQGYVSDSAKSHITNSVTIGSLPAISGTVTANLGSALPAGTNLIGVVTIGNIRRAGDGALTQLTTEVGSGALQTVIGAGTAQIGSVTASISNSVTIASLPAISGTVTANTFALQGTAVTTSNFTSTTASTVLANFNASREVLTIFNEGAGNLHICAGATCTTIAYQVRLSAGDYYEAPSHQSTITHSAVFATAGTARVTEIT